MRAISPFPTVFSKDVYCRHVKTRIVWKRVKKEANVAFFFQKKMKKLKHEILLPKLFDPFYKEIVATKLCHSNAINDALCDKSCDFTLPFKC